MSSSEWLGFESRGDGKASSKLLRVTGHAVHKSREPLGCCSCGVNHPVCRKDDGGQQIWESMCKCPGQTRWPAPTETVKWSAVETVPQPLASAPNRFLSPQALCTVNPSQTLSSNSTCLSPKITSPLLCSLSFARQQPQVSHLPVSAAITYNTDITYFKLSYTLFISPPTSPCVCFPFLLLTASPRWEQLKYCCYHHPLPPSLHSLLQNMGPALLAIPVLGTGSQFL